MENWQLMLKRMKLRHIEAKSPGFYKLSGGPKMKVNAYSDRDTNSLTKSILDFFKFNGIYSNRISSTGTARMIDGKLKYTHSGTRRGTFDIDCILPPGKACKIEVKCERTNDKLSEAQKKEIERLEQAGAIWYIAQNFPAFLKWYCDTTGTEMQSLLSPELIQV